MHTLERSFSQNASYVMARDHDNKQSRDMISENMKNKLKTTLYLSLLFYLLLSYSPVSRSGSPQGLCTFHTLVHEDTCCKQQTPE